MPRDKDKKSAEFSEAVIQQVLSESLDDETAAGRVKQIGLMAILDYMRANDIDPTVTNIIKITGLSRQAAFVLMEPLVRRGLLVEETVRNTQGRGRAKRFVIDRELAETKGKATRPEK
ncbi:MarR family transcriptional regulator [Ciceribacter sp. RN22]|uniref:MarR family transcriptional regulator n=1 Tax=Ciceribacter sp. RN22 TaxID=2954932 RepID=UPI002092A3BD|nr:MarR family transcriptional regulator [Ciceribacter sp. RN22]MCO6181110.1 MarR family transcriptional regulator [Ciceribacter sp. RN22]